MICANSISAEESNCLTIFVCVSTVSDEICADQVLLVWFVRIDISGHSPVRVCFVRSLATKLLTMPFIGRDWRDPGEAWVKTDEGSWEKLKILETSTQNRNLHHDQ